jgi:hypothetical protein
MSDTMTIELPEPVKKEIESAARAAGLSPEAFVADAAAKHARAMTDAKAFFAERAKRADFDEFDRIMNREGGEPPRPGDEIE